MHSPPVRCNDDEHEHEHEHGARQLLERKLDVVATEQQSRTAGVPLAGHTVDGRACRVEAGTAMVSAVLWEVGPSCPSRVAEPVRGVGWGWPRRLGAGSLRVCRCGAGCGVTFVRCCVGR